MNIFDLRNFFARRDAKKIGVLTMGDRRFSGEAACEYIRRLRPALRIYRERARRPEEMNK